MVTAGTRAALGIGDRPSHVETAVMAPPAASGLNAGPSYGGLAIAARIAAE